VKLPDLEAMPEEGGVLYVIGTPLGHLGDITLRALAVLAGVDALACEDTRRTWGLLSHYEIPRPGIFFSCNDHNEHKVVSRVMGLLDAGHRVGLVSDAGMPLVSDPGFVVARAAREAGHQVVVIPGPTAAVTGLLGSGLPVHAFCFKGFAPRKSGQRQRFIAADRENAATLIFYASPYRLSKLLADALAVLGDRPAALCVELTKKFEQIHRAPLSELVARFGEAPKGELTLLIHGFDKNMPPLPEAV
jgi:16S rRNA (cytidine1402-2'-O)-methyltransferase